MTTVVMVHGAFCGGWTFDSFRRPFEAQGWSVLAPDLRGHEPGAAPDSVAGLSMATYAAEVAELCASLPEPPVLLGHSMGGLVAQMAARRTKLRALVLLAPSPPWGVAGSSLEEGAIALGVHMMGSFFSGAVRPDRSLMRMYSLNRMPEHEREAIIGRMSVESGRAVGEALNWWLDPLMTTSVGAGILEAPSLALVGDLDVVHPPATVRQVARRIGAEVQVLPGLSHWLPFEPGWEGVAEEILGWLEREVRSAA